MAENQDWELPQRYRDILCHSLGTNSAAPGYRNSYCEEKDGRAYDTLCAMVEHGLMRRGRELNQGRDVYFHATELGAKCIGLDAESMRRAFVDMKPTPTMPRPSTGHPDTPAEHRCHICGGLVHFDGTPPVKGCWGGRE